MRAFKVALITVALVLFGAQPGALSHAPVKFKIPLPIHGTSVTPISGTLRRALINPFAGLTGSGATKAFDLRLRIISGATFTDAIKYAPLTNLTGQFGGVDYYESGAGFSAPFFVDAPAVVAFGKSSLNTGIYNLTGGPFDFTPTNVITNVTSTINFPVVHLALFPLSIGGKPLSGAERALARLYNSAASTGYNAGLTVLSHPTGGLLFGTGYYQAGTSPTNDYLMQPAFFAFGNNPNASASFASMISNNQMTKTPLTLTGPLTNYIQFGKYVRYISNGVLSGTYYQLEPHFPPYGAAVPGGYDAQGYFNLAIGSNPFNTHGYNGIGPENAFFPAPAPTYFK